jgi:CheY-like chemotaxis protein
MSIHQAMPILVAEDSEAAALIVRKLLWQVGLKNVDTAPDGLAALVKMSDKKYDLVSSPTGRWSR